ncbi:hypothetical protein [Sphingomonas sp. FW199]|uniref:hypothetical protein n=1 Tax=Sphingomonas sp. FW199 TaxID=3400217 RepID=UPI003CED6956
MTAGGTPVGATNDEWFCHWRLLINIKAVYPNSMTREIALQLYQVGRSHALSAFELYRASIRYAEERGLEDPEHFAFNGTFSLSTHYLLGLGLELMLKAAVCLVEVEISPNDLKRLGHNLLDALDRIERGNFDHDMTALRNLVEIMHQPYLSHWLRYEHPDQFFLPGDLAQVQETLRLFDETLEATFQE